MSKMRLWFGLGWRVAAILVIMVLFIGPIYVLAALLEHSWTRPLVVFAGVFVFNFIWTHVKKRRAARAAQDAAAGPSA